ncbi:phage tail tube protein [Cohnella cholangitidis]|uniref:Terminase n=1 Tax=Cohnella cholangitidis TaxID=2598458 RepID=A0A7G5C3F8_9BACL|nr:phage tail tube protein [Cohnella cholangitidis]QMV43742.1 terminase [Cohnella cholangitidis]
MTQPNGKRQINGSFGSVWWDGELLADIDSFEAKISIDREEVNMAGSLSKDSKMTGWSGEGTMTVKKVYSRAQRKIALAIKRGEDIRSKIVAKLADPDAYGTERVVLENVWFNEVTLMKFEQKTPGTEDIPFGFSDYNFPDLIPAA